MKALCSTVILTAVALLTLILPVPVYSAMMGMPMQEHRGAHGQMMGMCTMDKMGDMMGTCLEHAASLGLTDGQMAKMKPVHREMQKKQAQFIADQKIAEIELMEIMEVKDFDLEKAGAAVKKIEAIKTAHHLEMLKAMKEMRTILTDEQFKNMQKVMPMKSGEKKSGMKRSIRR